MLELSVILPTYNEAGNIIPLVLQIKEILKKAKIKGEIVIVDDESPDGTAKLVRDTFGDTDEVRIFVRKKEKGLASAVFYGIKKSFGGKILVMDTDFNHDPKIIPEMMSVLENADLVIGCRYIKGGGMENRWRYWLSYLYNIYVRMILGISVHDFLSGFFAVRKSEFNTLSSEKIFYGFGDYFIRLIYYLNKNATGSAFESPRSHHPLFLEIPVYYKNRVYGESKSQFLKLFLMYTFTTLKLRFEL